MNKEKEIIEKEKDDIGCELWIYTGEKEPDFVTEKTGLIPSRIRIKGKPWFDYGRGKIVEQNICQENIWIFSHRIIVTNAETYLGQPLSELLKQIESKESIFKEFFLNPEYTCLILCFGYYHDYHIYFRLSPEIIKKINEWNLNLDFDLYSFS